MESPLNDENNGHSSIEIEEKKDIDNESLTSLVAKEKSNTELNPTPDSPDPNNIQELSNSIDLNTNAEQNTEIKNETLVGLINSDLDIVDLNGDNVIENEKLEHSKVETESDIEADWLSTNLEDVTDRETILGYVNRLQKFVKKQNKKIRKLRSKLKYYKTKCRNKISVDASSQVEINEEKVEPQSEATQPKSIADEIKEAAEEAVAQTTFVYEATSGMYYDYSTGYYYNAELGLYYDGNKGTYLKYDEQTKTYHFHSQVEMQKSNYMEDAYGKRKNHSQAHKRIKRKKLKQKSDKSEEETKESLEDGECTTSSSNDSDYEDSEVLSITSDDDDDMDVKGAGGDTEKCAPCVRLIVRDTETDSKRVKTGQLHIVTVDGGTIGREGDHSVLLAEVGVSRLHARITYDGTNQTYSVKDCGSRNGTWLDGEKVEASGNAKRIKHGSVLKVGTISLTCHIHEGKRTCGHCEPGLLVQEQKKTSSAELPKSDKKSAHRQELKRLRNKYGFCPQVSIAPKVEMPEGFVDKAEHRRKYVGSWGIYEKTEVTTETDSIKPTNKGFKLLEKMGWSEGQSLGKSGEGITEPIQAVANAGSAGLGCSEPIPIANDPKAAAKTEVWLKTRERYDRLLQPNAHPAFASDSE